MVRRGWIRAWLMGGTLCAGVCGGAGGAAGQGYGIGSGQSSEPRPVAQDPNQLIATLLAHEQDATGKRGRYFYVSEERSDRTDGHLWRERVAETPWGKVRFLVAEDGQALTGARLAAERARVEAEAADPEGFKRQEAAKGDDEQHARSMLTLLPKAFLFDGPATDGETLRVGFRPNPSYQPQGLEERVLHGMSGTVLIDRGTVRLRGLEGKVPEDISIGFGLLATIKAGSNFETMRVPVGGIDWKTLTIHTDINGKAMFLKTIARKQESKHSDFKRIPNEITVAEAVKMVEAGE